MKKIMLIFGTRPEAVKMCPLVLELKKRNNIKTVVCVTGQHREMLKSVLDVFQVVPDYNLDIMKDGQNLFDITMGILKLIGGVLAKENPDMVLVHGDTSTSFTSALACFYMDIPVGHVEAGLRTYNLHSPYPEEFNRQAVSIIAKYNFAPTEKAKSNLLQEHKSEQSIFVTGNTVIDAMKITVKEEFQHPILDWAGDSRILLLTTHRRENIGEAMEHIFKAVRRISDEISDVKIIFPIHMNPQIRKICQGILGDCKKVKIVDPLDVVTFHNIMARSYIIVTDSGGIQEEAPSLGKPVIVCRDTTERPEGIRAGTLLLAGVSQQDIYASIHRVLKDKDLYTKMSKAINPYGDGKACIRIADIIEFGEVKHDG